MAQPFGARAVPTHPATGRFATLLGLAEGELPDVTVIALIEFPTVEACKAFVNDPDYAPFAQARQAGTDSNFYVIDDTDLAQSIPYLPQG